MKTTLLSPIGAPTGAPYFSTSALETPPIRCLIVSDNAMHRLTLEHYVGLLAGLRLAGSLGDGVEAYDYLHRGGEVDLVILDMSSVGISLGDLRPASHPDRPRWLLIEQMGNIPAFNCEQSVGRLAQPLCFSHFGKLVRQAMGQRQVLD